MGKREYQIVIFSLICAIASLAIGMSRNATRPTPTSPVLDSDRLANLIASGALQKADRQTYRMMLSVLHKKNRRLTRRDIARFPCGALAELDRTWHQSSNGQLSFIEPYQRWKTARGGGRYQGPTAPLSWNVVRSSQPSQNNCLGDREIGRSATPCLSGISLNIFERIESCKMAPYPSRKASNLQNQ
jgi:hypothetical protein